MKFPDIAEIRKMRKSLGMTQTELAAASGVSQSTIAKIESGNTSASYATVVKLFESLYEQKDRRRIKVKAIDVASQPVTSVQVNQTVHEASDIMKSTGFSQLPVLDGDIPMGSISEKSIFRLLNKGVTTSQLRATPVSDVMDDIFPVVSYDTPVSSIAELIYNVDAVLVLKKGKFVGMVTNADLLKLI